MPKTTSNRGAVSIYIALIVLTTVISSALILSSILSRQIRISEGLTSSERAFYAAGSGVEEALYELTQRQQTLDSSPFTVEGEIAYPGSNAEYSVSAALFFNQLLTNSRPCVKSRGSYQQQERRINLKNPGDEC